MNEWELDVALALRCGRLGLSQAELVGERVRDMALPESMHQTAAAQAASVDRGLRRRRHIRRHHPRPALKPL